ncbi:MAG: DUF2782 domain-containing protein [Gammaproteobacteria bacterium]|nr:DUF2782 domain-containing protein [Gammaproteobacteria bacterium]
MMLLAWTAAPAAAPPQAEPPPPPAMPEDDGAQSLEPEVTIIQRDETTIEEYSVNGRVYMVKIIPAKGYPYYLVDSDGDGRLDTHHGTLREGENVPRWILFRW